MGLRAAPYGALAACGSSVGGTGGKAPLHAGRLEDRVNPGLFCHPSQPAGRPACPPGAGDIL